MIKHSENLAEKNIFLHEQYKSNWGYYKEFIDLIDNIIKSYSSFAASLNNILANKKKNFNSFFDKKSNNIFYDLIQNLKYHIKLESQEYKDLSSLIIRDIIEPFKRNKNTNDKNEENIFKNYNDFLKKVKASKTKLEENKNNYYTKMKETEKLIVEEKSMKVNELTSNQEIKDKKDIAFESICESLIYEEKYLKSIEEVNKMIEEKNTKEKNLFNFYKEIETKRLSSIKENYFYLITNIKTTNCKINCDIDEISSKYIGLKTENDIDKYIESNKTNLFSEKNIEFKPYTPFSSLNNSINITTQNEQMNINYEVILNLQKFFTNICDNLDMEEEKKRKRFRLLCLNIFDQNQQSFVKEDEDELINLMKIKEYRNYFLSTLTNQRINGKFKREEKLFNELFEILNAILDIAEKEKNYENARNCIILSQTFYKETNIDGEIEKIYLMEYLKNNKWISNPKFWKDFIEDEIIKDGLKFEEENKIRQIEGKKVDVTKIYFSKLITHVHNMNMFGLTKNDNSEIINYFINKYNIPEDLKQIILNDLENIYSAKKDSKKVKQIPKTKENKENIEEKKIENENNKEIQNKKEKKDNKKNDIEKISDEWVIEDYGFNENKKEEDKKEDEDNKINENEIKTEEEDVKIKTDEEILNEGTLKINELFK